MNFKRVKNIWNIWGWTLGNANVAEEAADGGIPPPSAESGLKNSATEDGFWCNSGSFGVKNFYSLYFFFIFWRSWSILHAVKKRRVKEKR